MQLIKYFDLKNIYITLSPWSLKSPVCDGIGYQVTEGDHNWFLSAGGYIPAKNVFNDIIDLSISILLAYTLSEL